MLSSNQYKLAGFFVHLFTAAAAVVALFTLSAIAHKHYATAFTLMALAVLIDSLDGTFARKVHIQTYIPSIDGALMDNMVDFLNYAITPCFLALSYHPLLPNGIREIVVSLVVLASAYQFTQADAKTDDHFFKGFPCYWNIVIFYLFIYSTWPWLNALILFTLVVMVFVPIKYLYLSRMEHAIHDKKMRYLILAFSTLYGVAMVGMLITYPHPWHGFLYFTLLYSLGYIGLSFYLTAKLIKPKNSSYSRSENA